MVSQSALELAGLCSPGQLLVLGKGFLKALFINGKAFFLCKLLCKLNGETVGVIQFEGAAAGDLLYSLFLKEVGHLLKLLLTLLQCEAELLLLCSELGVDLLLVFLQFRVGLSVELNHNLCNLGKE